MSNKKVMGFGAQLTKKGIDLSRLSLKSNVYYPHVFILKDGRKVSLNPKVIRDR
jgi:hypothetical protein